MAIDQAEKRRALARQCVQTAPLLMNVLYSLDALRSQRDNGGPNGTPLVFTVGLQGSRRVYARGGIGERRYSRRPLSLDSRCVYGFPLRNAPFYGTIVLSVDTVRS